MEQKKRFSPPVSGICSLLVIFALLVFSVFMMLTITTVQADKRLADTHLDSVQAYYTADLQAEEIFALLRSGEKIPQVQQEGTTYRYTYPISETQNLEVTVCLDDGVWQVLRWQAVPIWADTPNETLPVWQGSASQEEHYD